MSEPRKVHAVIPVPQEVADLVAALHAEEDRFFAAWAERRRQEREG